MSKPIIYAAFANKDDNHLPLLKQESSEVKDALRVLETRDFIKVEREESAEIKDIINTFSSYPNQISIFHYGGHAESDLLQLEDTDAHAKGLASILGEQEQLQLVFLNGCSTRGHVEGLFAKGVKAVIATSVPIEDRKSLVFASSFYKAMAHKRSIKLAFDFAKSMVETEFKDAPAIEIFRGIAIPETPGTTEEIPWGLYIHDNGEDVLSWRLPYYRQIGLPKEMITYIGQNVELNKYVVMVLDEMCKYNKDIYHQMVEVIDGEEVKKDSSTYIDIVIRNFPWVIGSQLQLVLQQKKPDLKRLEQLVSTYEIAAIVLYYILLSDVWDGLRRNKIQPPKNFLKDIKQSRSNILSINFLQQISDLYEFAQSKEIELFVPEFEKFCLEIKDSGSHLAKANAYLNGLKGQFAETPSDQLVKACTTAEQALAVVLRSAAFLADYKMLTVRNITIDNPRYKKKTYELDLGILNAIVNTSLSLYEDDAKKRKESYANCNSIILVPSEKDMRQSLNLSPFIIDKNTFLNNHHIDLFIYGFEEENAYHYFAIKHSIFIALENKKGTDILDTTMTLNDFVEGKNITQKSQEKEDDFGFGEAFGFEETDVATEDSPKVFTLLEGQFEQFKTDFSL